MNVGAKFDRFISNIQLTETQVNDAKNKHEGVRDCLKSHYYPVGYVGTIGILIGSYGKGTACRPPADVDILFLMPAASYDKYNNPNINGQSQLLQDVKNVLLNKYPNTAMRADGQVVVVSFTGSFSVEVIPVFKYWANDVYQTPDTHNGGSWKTTNPAAEKNNIINSNSNSAGKATHLIKMMKVWRYSCSVPIKSLALELVCVDFVNQWQHRDKTSLFYDFMIRDSLEYLISKKNGSKQIPGISELCSFGSDWESKAISAHERAKKACAYELDGKIETDKLANDEWQKIFGNYFQG